MPMKKDINTNTKIYRARVQVNGDRVYKLTKKEIHVESYLDKPSVSPEEFWRDYAYSGLADEWFPHLDPDSIAFVASSGQYDIGTDIRAYGKLLGDHRDLIQGIKDEMSKRDDILKHNEEIEKKIEALKKTKQHVPSWLSFST